MFSSSPPLSSYPAETVRKPPSNPVILILGATGTGKSALALSICAHLSRLLPTSSTIAPALAAAAEIINADAMQLYRGLPVITNKLPLGEQQGLPHHLLDLIPLEQEPWTVHEFVRAADEKIAEVRGRGRVPVVVGGTGYYARALVWRDGVLREGTDGDEDGAGGGRAERDGKEVKAAGSLAESMKKWPILDASSEEMYDELKRLDPEMAERWHPRDWRRVQKSLEICLRTGRKVSEIYKEQAEARQTRGEAVNKDTQSEVEDSNSNASGQLRYDPLVLWLSAEDGALKDRLNARVGDMVEQGLFEEALELHKREKEFKTQGVSIDKTKGIWVSIGYKEMEPWAEQQFSNPLPLDEAKETPLAKECLEAVKAGTRRYAKRQERYIRITISRTLDDAGLPSRLMLLDGSNLDRFHSHLVPQAEELVSAFLQGRELPEPATLSKLAKDTFEKMSSDGQKSEQRAQHYCDVCDRIMMNEKEWKIHVAGNGHKKVLQGRRKHEQKLEYLQRARGSNESQSEQSPLIEVPS
jgi:tRNA dimethylallyltransferase